MKKSLKLLVVFCLVMLQTAFAQNINLKFKSSTTEGKYVQLDSIRIENLNQNWVEMLFYPDTVLTLTVETSISEEEIVSPTVLSYPNPFRGTTSVFLTMLQSESVTLQVYNIAGQRIMEKQVQVEAGENHFEISLDRSQVYFLVAQTSHGQMVQKLINIGNSGENSLKYIGTTQGTIQKNTQKLLSNKKFLLGDMLRINGYVTANGNVINSNEILQSQTESETFTLFFAMQNSSLPTIFTTTVSNITDSSAVSGGIITNDGGATIMVRGVCWDTIPNPTINSNHTIDGSNTGSFTSVINGLIDNTTYYVRAYATNAIGTAYGNQVSFTTAAKINLAVFSVSTTDSVIFSPGNLQWSATNGGNTATTHAVTDSGTAAGTWRFAPNQWDMIGYADSNISSTYTGWIDLFGWGTSGYNNKHPYRISLYDSTYANGDNHISGSNYDWGVYNAIYNPKTQTTDAPGTWRTLTKDEWVYLLNTRPTASSIRYAKATVYGIVGLIIVPDNCNSVNYSLNNVNTPSAEFTSNIIGASDWAKMEAVGCVFLPAAGFRNGTLVDNVGINGRYWSSTNTTRYVSHKVGACYFNFNSKTLNPSDYWYRCKGMSVRLVKDVK